MGLPHVAELRQGMARFMIVCPRFIWTGLAGCLSVAAVCLGWGIGGRGSSDQVAGTVRNAPVPLDGRTMEDGGWPQIFGPRHNSTSQLIFDPRLPVAGAPSVWRVEVGEGYSAPVALGSDVIVFHRPGNSVAADPSSQTGSHEAIWCLDFATGNLKWEFRHPTSFVCRTHYSSGPYSTPIIDQHRVYALGTEGKLYCLARESGELLWMRDLNGDYQVEQEGYFPVATSPLLWDDRLLINVGGGKALAGIVAIDKQDGRTLWTATDHAASYATPRVAVIHGRTLLFVFTREGLAALDPVSGREYWWVPFRANNPEFVNATSPIVCDDIVFTSGYSLGNLCLRVLPDGSYQELWRDQRRNLDSQYNPLICLDGSLYGFAALDHTFRCLDLATGKVRWKGLRELDRGAAIAAGDYFVVWGTNGHLAILRIDSRRMDVVAQTKEPLLAGPTYAFPALHRGHLLVRNDHELICVGLQSAGRR